MDANLDVHHCFGFNSTGAGQNFGFHDAEQALKGLIQREALSAKYNKKNYEECLIVLGENSVDRHVYEMLRTQNRMHFMRTSLQGMHRSAMSASRNNINNMMLYEPVNSSKRSSRQSSMTSNSET